MLHGANPTAADVFLGYVPFVVTVLLVTALFWAATRLFPKFGQTMHDLYDAMMGGTDEEIEAMKARHTEPRIDKYV